MIFFKSCQRCRGDLHMDRDHFGWYIKCLQCGRSKDLPEGFASVPSRANSVVQPAVDSPQKGMAEAA